VDVLTNSTNDEVEGFGCEMSRRLVPELGSGKDVSPF